MADLTLPVSLPKSLPADLVRQRPDILQSEAQLHVACANVGVATAALFPSFTLSGAVGANHSSLGDVFSSSGGFWSYGLDITAPLFRGGTLIAQKNAATEAFRAAAANYRQSVLGGLSQVADTLRALEHDAEQTEAQSLARSAAEQALKLLLVNYRAGTVTYLQVLTANTQYQQARIAELQAIAQRFQDTVALFVALGGGWWKSEKGVVDQLLRQSPTDAK